ncbi:MAG: vitamin K epoxide reductase family protein [Cyanobacteria bacterium P01_A01_bin.114]
MGRRRQDNRLLYRWSRPLIGAIATVGALGTGYLTVIKFMSGSAACPTSGCDQVLSSPYATIFGLPLTLFGCLAYLGMVTLALGPLLINPDLNKELRQKLENWSWLLLFIGATGMMVFSGYLMYILTTELKAACLYCIASAAFTALMFVLTLLGRSWDDRGQLVFTGLIVAVVALVGTLGIYAPINAPNSSIASTGEVGPPVTNPSGEAELALARHLTQIDAKMYGAYWCPHCHDQKQLFGQAAAKEIPYIECADDGQNSQADLCRSVSGLTGFPTWEVNGQFLSGTQTLQALAEASGYSGPQEFAN